MRAALLLCVLAACGDNLVPETESPTEFRCDSTGATGSKKLVLAFDGVQLNDNGVGDARYNLAAFVDNQVATIPAWRAGDPNRDEAIAEITCRLRETLFAYDIFVTQERPALTEDYQLVVFGGTSHDLGKPVAVHALTDSDCGNANMRDVAWVAEFFTATSDRETVQASAAYAAAMFGAANALVPSRDETNCMCLAGRGESCSTVGTACTFTDAAPVRGNDDFCQTGKPAQDQVTLLLDTYGARVQPSDGAK